MDEKRKRVSPTPPELGAHGAKFWRHTLTEWTLGELEKQILLGICRNLDEFHRCADLIKTEGTMAVSARGSKVRPEVSLMKDSWRSFLQGCKALGIPEEEEAPKAIGRPAGDPRQYKEYWQRRGGYG